MRVATGKVVGGEVIFEGTPFEEGTEVVILGKGDDDMFQLGPEDEAELMERIAEAERGETVSLEEVLAILWRR